MLDTEEMPDYVIAVQPRQWASQTAHVHRVGIAGNVVLQVIWPAIYLFVIK